jgi:hypothetical protein
MSETSNSGEGKSTLSDLRSTSGEDSDNKSYFKIDTRMNDSEAPPVGGAKRVSDHITIKLKQPVTKTSTSKAVSCPDRADPRDLSIARQANRCWNSRSMTVRQWRKVYNTLSVIGQPIPDCTLPPPILYRQRQDEDADA